jgi:uncharacterized repeat protein (TIGR02543 family)
MLALRKRKFLFFAVILLALSALVYLASPAQAVYYISTVDSTGDVGEDSSIAVDTNNKAHISYLLSGYSDLRYATNGSGSWETSTIDSAGISGACSSIALDTNNKVHISYLDFTNGDLRYATNESGLWVTSTIDSTGDVGRYTSIAIDSNNKVHISYLDFTNGDLKYATNLTDFWVTSTIDSTGDVGWYSSIAIDSNKKAHISYYDVTNWDLKYATNASGSWAPPSTIDSPWDVGRYTSIAVDSSNKVHISYYDNYNKDLKYTTNASGLWVTSTIDSTGDVGQYSSIAINVDGGKHISYYDATNGDLKHATYYPTLHIWNSDVIDSAGDVGQYSSLAFGSNGAMHISYYDVTNHTLKYATDYCQLGAPSLTSPSNGATGVSTTLTLYWSDVSEAESYTILLCSDGNCTSVVATTSVPTSQWTVTPALNNNTQYWWRVRASKSCGPGAWSTIWSFTTCTPPAAPTMISPSNGATGVSTTPTLDWSDVYVADFDNYIVQVCSDSSCSNVVATGYPSISQWQVTPALTQGIQYWWRVIVLPSLCNPGSWSNIWSFTTVPIANYTLSLAKTGNGSVKVNSTAPPALPWSGQFSSGTNVQIEAVADSGWTFANWTGDLAGSANPTDVNMNGNKNITANFTQNCDRSLTINISPANSGTVTKNPDKASYCYNEQVTLTANPNSGYNFSSWSGADSSSGTTAQVTMSSNKTVTATFIQTPVVNYTLSLAKTGNGSVKVNSTAPPALPWSGQFTSGVNVQIEAVADSGWSFANWTGDQTGSTNPITIAMSGNKNITANFTQNSGFSLTINISPPSSGTVTKNPDKASYFNNEEVTLKANPNSGYNFSSWSGVDSSTGLTANITMNGDRTVDATFSQKAANEPDINVTPESKGFGNKKLGEISAPESITVNNTGSGDLVIGPLSIKYDDAGVFTKQNDNCSGKTLNQSEHCVVDVVFSPVTMGSFHAGLLIPSNDVDEPAKIVDLKGGSGADLTGTWISMKETCKNTKKGIKCSLKGNLTVQNTGNIDVKKSSVKFYLSDDGIYDGGDTYLKKVSTGKVKAGKSQKKTISYSFKTGFSTSGKYVIAVLDADGQVVEADKSNNNIVYGPLP